jgi:hypothetical protein
MRKRACQRASIAVKTCAVYHTTSAIISLLTRVACTCQTAPLFYCCQIFLFLARCDILYLDASSSSVTPLAVGRSCFRLACSGYLVHAAH